MSDDYHSLGPGPGQADTVGASLARDLSRDDPDPLKLDLIAPVEKGLHPGTEHFTNVCECGRRFAKQQGLNLHRVRAHGDPPKYKGKRSREKHSVKVDEKAVAYRSAAPRFEELVATANTAYARDVVRSTTAALVAAVASYLDHEQADSRELDRLAGILGALIELIDAMR